MSDFSIEISIDGKPVSIEEVRAAEHHRALHSLGVLADAGIDVTLGGKSLDRDEIASLSREDAVAAGIETKVAAGPERIREAMADVLSESEESWKGISEKSEYGKNLQNCFTDMVVHGMDMKTFLAFNQKLNTSDDPGFINRGAFGINPEHYAFKAIPGVGQHIIENLGQYKPVDTVLNMTPSDFLPVELDDDTVFHGKTEFFLANGNVPMKTWAMHQFKPRPDGFAVKLGIFFPEAAPKELVDGHHQHFCIEFLNAFTLCHMMTSQALS